MTLAEYFKACSEHDWFYMMSDDRHVYHRGADREKFLIEQAKVDSDRLEIFTAWRKYHYTQQRLIDHLIQQPIIIAKFQRKLENIGVNVLTNASKWGESTQFRKIPERSFAWHFSSVVARSTIWATE